MKTPPDYLAEELATFERHRARLAKGHGPGWFVLICADQIAGVYQDEMDAVGVGCVMFCGRPFLVKECLAEDRVLFYPAAQETRT